MISANRVRGGVVETIGADKLHTQKCLYPQINRAVSLVFGGNRNEPGCVDAPIAKEIRHLVSATLVHNKLALHSSMSKAAGVTTLERI